MSSSSPEKSDLALCRYSPPYPLQLLINQAQRRVGLGYGSHISWGKEEGKRKRDSDSIVLAQSPKRHRTSAPTDSEQLSGSAEKFHLTPSLPTSTVFILATADDQGLGRTSTSTWGAGEHLQNWDDQESIGDTVRTSIRLASHLSSLSWSQHEMRRQAYSSKNTVAKDDCVREHSDGNNELRTDFFSDNDHDDGRDDHNEDEDGHGSYLSEEFTNGDVVEETSDDGWTTILSGVSTRSATAESDFMLYSRPIVQSTPQHWKYPDPSASPQTPSSRPSIDRPSRPYHTETDPGQADSFHVSKSNPASQTLRSRANIVKQIRPHRPLISPKNAAMRAHSMDQNTRAPAPGLGAELVEYMNSSHQTNDLMRSTGSRKTSGIYFCDIRQHWRRLSRDRSLSIMIESIEDYEPLEGISLADQTPEYETDASTTPDEEVPAKTGVEQEMDLQEMERIRHLWAYSDSQMAPVASFCVSSSLMTRPEFRNDCVDATRKHDGALA